MDTQARRKALREKYRKLPQIEESTFLALQEVLKDTPPAEEWVKQLTT